MPFSIRLQSSVKRDRRPFRHFVASPEKYILAVLIKSARDMRCASGTASRKTDDLACRSFPAARRCLRVPHHKRLHFRNLPIFHFQAQCDHPGDGSVGRPALLLDGPDEGHRPGRRVVHKQTIRALAHHRIPKPIGITSFCPFSVNFTFFRQRRQLWIVKGGDGVQIAIDKALQTRLRSQATLFPLSLWASRAPAMGKMPQHPHRNRYFRHDISISHFIPGDCEPL